MKITHSKILTFYFTSSCHHLPCMDGFQIIHVDLLVAQVLNIRWAPMLAILRYLSLYSRIWILSKSLLFQHMSDKLKPATAMSQTMPNVSISHLKFVCGIQKGFWILFFFYWCTSLHFFPRRFVEGAWQKMEVSLAPSSAEYEQVCMSITDPPIVGAGTQMIIISMWYGSVQVIRY